VIRAETAEEAERQADALVAHGGLAQESANDHNNAPRVADSFAVHTFDDGNSGQAQNRRYVSGARTTSIAHLRSDRRS